MLRRARIGLLAVVVVTGACQTPPRGTTASDSTSPNAHPQSTATPIDAAPLHNVLRVSDRLISGSMPEDDAGFDTLAAMGVKTIISVDGATPDVARAHARGMRYVHVPVGYDGIDAAPAHTLARAARDLPGPIYVHCHHGKHRGPAACGLIAIELGEMKPEDGDAFLRRAGASPDYPGLFASVAEAAPLSPAELDATAAEFPEIAPRPAFVKAMSQAQDTFDHLTEIRDAGWSVPAQHPDLVPAAEAARLESLLRGLFDDPKTARHPADFRKLLTKAQAAAATFEGALTSGQPRENLSALLAALGDSCRTCHVAYRNRRGE